MPWMAIKKKKKMKTIITERLGEGHMGRYCTDVGGKRKKKPSRIRSIYTVYVTESMVILMNSIIIIV